MKKISFTIISKHLYFEVTIQPTAGYIVTKKKKLSQTTRPAFHFPHAAPIPYTLTASLVKASANKIFLYLTIVSI